MRYVYTPSDEVCTRSIILEIENGIIRSVQFVGGCPGNTQGVAGLAKGMKVEDVIGRLQHVPCGGRSTSCPAELAKALEQALSEENDSAKDTAEKHTGD
ncbi:TIGR03905 family TSCPD domain-containing protein [Ethanoligenens harbinense]|uniref:ribonucleoside-diphosphate reductase n=1 Tax=Ethanoligenens harbinense (strain DSM 18485 / JCM 12961 / CGMCC 1.5033 / YUAN-3) TaxID=663278 RepID=E6U8B3_ETHHY|nr:TIGR03905 family TSCPD domain-containing protein [Ethanoligenens harbinense]ADU28232.1 hypothetical protein Ethha_2740 [Ethanoligenens harbinense YUAN-3]AVQ97228.1 TIGR03905 family protein [Ethanoligenens harbinense YUAN-3]AYF39893.1 TIGR03905 family protein [Ethanoligenens harbinense]AYF43021.1 TIGR03905 family protein [Ethanoligenens harbinense]QCN93781.1 TIGR03905 family TSCPD domain-containing protein [Ethanoligenens harbinense]